MRGKVGVNIPTINESSDGEMEFVLNEVGEIKAGGAFGELSLLYESPRTATITCKEDCDFAILNKSEYKEILSIWVYSTNQLICLIS